MSTIISKNKTYCILLIYIGALQFIFYLCILPEKTTRQIFIENKELLEYPCCVSNTTDEFRTNIVFAKLNTTGGAVIINVLSRFSLRYQLNVLIPDAANNSHLVPVQGTETIDNKYNMIFLYDKFVADVYELTYPNTFSITILEDPIFVFQVAYNKYRVTAPYGNFKDFIAKVASNADGLMFNPTSIRLGLRPEYHNNETEIRNFIQQIERKFDLVMIYELIMPSLIFLANLMGWPKEYVTNEFSFISPVENYDLTDINRIKLAEWNMADMMLYEYFFKKLENCALQYGVEQLVGEMKTLNEYNQGIKKYCSDQMAVPKRQELFDCDGFVQNDKELVERIKQQQIKRMNYEKSMNYFVIY